MIEVEELHKRFGPVQAVNGMTSSAPDGSITALLGENGAGKTTTLALICGLVRPDAGSIRVGAAAPDPLSRRRHIGALLDHKGLYGRLTARENIAYFGALHGLWGATLDARVNHSIGVLGLEQIADRRVAGFSQGERMKIALGASCDGSSRLRLRSRLGSVAERCCWLGSRAGPTP